MKRTLAISIGDLNGVGIGIALRAHDEVVKLCRPLYCVNDAMLQQAASLLQTEIPEGFTAINVEGSFIINPGEVCAKSGRYAYDSFMQAIALAESKEADGVVTLPIHKEAWMKAGLEFKGHTDLLRKHFDKEAIMMLGCEEMYVALYTEHTPLKEVPAAIEEERLTRFLIDLQRETKADKIAVLGLNPHAGDNGVLGDEERIIERAIAGAGRACGNVFDGPLVPDTAFTPAARKEYTYYCAMYHDQGLIPLKALYFDESINVSLNLPVIRTSVDHGTAFDIAYKRPANTLSYLNAVKAAITVANGHKNTL